MFKCKDANGKQIYVGDMVNIWDTETEDWQVVPGTEQYVEAQIEAIPEEGMVQVNPLNLGEIDVVYAEETKVSYSLIHNMLHLEDAEESIEDVMKAAEQNYEAMFAEKGKKRKKKKQKQTKFADTGKTVEM